MVGQFGLQLGATPRILTPPPPSFDPLSIGWQAAWWASLSANLLAEGAAVSLVEDATAGNRDLTGSGSNRPTYRLTPVGFRGKPAWEFVAANVSYLTTAMNAFSGVSAQPFDLAMVFKQSVVNNGTYKAIMSGISPNPPEFLTNLDTTWWPYAGNSLGSWGTVDTNPHAVLIRYNGTSSKMWIDNVPTATADVGAWACVDMIFGCRSGGSLPWGGILLGLLDLMVR